MVIKRSAKHLPQGPGPGMENVQEPSALGIPNQEISQTYPPPWKLYGFYMFLPIRSSCTTHGIIFPHGLVYIDIIDPYKRI
jgi:hypothetical protein